MNKNSFFRSLTITFLVKLKKLFPALEKIISKKICETKKLHIYLQPISFI